MNNLLIAVTLLFAAQASAQSLHKCRDAAGKVTYASQVCEELGLKPAGDIQERTSVAPAVKAPPPPTPPRPKPSAASQGQPGKTDAEADAGKNPDKRCFKTAKGSRCNDKPEND